jgi:N-acetylglucosaminyl-diphospho-decaprenol L-rhamnosyltransferase
VTRGATPFAGVVIVNHNTREHLRGCLSAVSAAGSEETIVVDTDSTDGSADLVRREFPAVELIEVENRGYGAAANAGLRRSRRPYVLLLNADTRPDGRALAALSAYLERHPRVAVAGPLVVDERGTPERTARAFPTPFEILLQETGLHRLRSASRDARPGCVDWVLGAALALRRNPLAEVGGFDESFFMYNEEVDLCLRLRQAGWETHYAPVAAVAHVGGASTSQYRAAMAEQYVLSTARLYSRHASEQQRVRLRRVLVAALVAKRVRDSGRLLVARDAARRRRVRADLDAWRAAHAAVRSSLGS